MRIIREGAKECFEDLPLEVNWAPTQNCNYRCSYCFIYGKGKRTPPPLPFSTLEQLKIAVDNIASLNRPWYDIVFSGGEPTFHPRITELIIMLHEKLGKRLNHILIITNGSRNNALYEKIADLAKEISISMNISIHTDHVDMNHILDLINNLSAAVKLNFAIMFNPDKREFVHEIYDIMLEQRKKFYFNFDVMQIRDGDRIDSRYTPEDFAWYKTVPQGIRKLLSTTTLPQPTQKKSFRRMNLFTDIEEDGEKKTLTKVDYSNKYTNGMIQFKGMYCMAYAALLRISATGNCSGLVCTDSRPIGNIFEPDVFLNVHDKLIQAIKCSRAICGCSSNYRVPKFASEEEAKKYLEFAQKRQAELFNEYDATQAIKTI